MAVARLIKTAILFGVARSAVSKVVTAFGKRRKNLTHRSKSLEEIESYLRGTVRIFRELLGRITRIHSPKITEDLQVNDHLENPVSSKTIRRELHKAGFHGRAAIIISLFCPIPVYMCVCVCVWDIRESVVVVWPTKEFYRIKDFYSY